MENREKSQQGVLNLEIGFHIANALAQDGSAKTFGEIAALISQPASKTHRFLVSLCRVGILAQNPDDGRYRIGGGAIFLGLAGQRMLDEYQRLEEVINDLRRDTRLTVAVSVWGTHGPVVIRRLEAVEQILVIAPRIGTTLSMVSTAGGRLFAAFMSPDEADAICERDLALEYVSEATGKVMTRTEFKRIIGSIQRDRISTMNYRSGYDYSAIAVPVFAPDGQILFSLGIVGPRAVDMSPTGPTAEILKAAARRLEEELGVSATRHDPLSTRKRDVASREISNAADKEPHKGGRSPGSE